MRNSILFTILCFTWCPSGVIAEVRVTGNAPLLTRITQSLSAAQVAFPKGEIRYSYRETRPGHEETTAHVLSQWVGENQYWEYSYVFHDYNLAAPLPNGDTELVEIHEGVRRLSVNGEVSIFFPETGRHGYLYKSAENRRQPEYLAARPRDRWYRREFRRWTWDKYLAPESPSDYVTEINVKQDGDEVRVVRFAKDGASLELVFSIMRGLNLTSYRTIAALEGPASDDGQVHTGQYEWSDIGNGKWAPKSISFQEANVETPDKPFLDVRIDVESFRELSKSPSHGFSEKALEVPRKALVHRTSQAGQRSSYRYGNPDGADLISENVLKELADELRRQDFAKPD